MIETIAVVLTGVGLAASILYYANIIKNANKTQTMQMENRLVQLFMQTYNRFQDPDFLKMYNEVRDREWDSVEGYFEKYGPSWDPTILSV